jgi:hypothetical protein
MRSFMIYASRQRMGLAGHAAYMGEECVRVLVGKFIGERSLGGLEIGGRIMLNGSWTGLIWLRIWTSGGPL